MIELFTSAFITFLVIIDPPGCAPIFASLTRGTDAAHRRKRAVRSSVVAWCILIFVALLGEALLDKLGIDLASFRLAGGIMLFIIALEMVFEKRTERREVDAQLVEQRLAEQREENQDAPRDHRRSDRHFAAVRGIGAARQRGKDRRAPRRVDDHQQGDKRRSEQLDHLGAAIRWATTGTKLLPFHNCAANRRSPFGDTVHVQCRVWSDDSP